ncbi:hypothetical protein SADUNF_Sadunf03G0081400 [Salix dunnii]|uniref:Flavin-containing monooxygenase n=1 Tax=Salix dunnii TaxID=1413687 RepID=A0A835N1V9_9ROSI|nr:hypothetical protein SADUNF_Sadunf03G0081400 [Salix dunnii]
MVDNGKWKVKSQAKRLVDSGFLDENFDAVVVCSGHVTDPRIAGINLWPGKQIHIHNYPTPEPFRNRGCANSTSAAALSIEIAEVESANGDGTVVFRDGSAVVADIILHRTGLGRPESYNDHWEDDDLILQTRDDFEQIHLK